MSEAYWKRLRKIGDVATQELLKGYCEKDKKNLYQQILKLPTLPMTQSKSLPKSHGIYFALNQEDGIIYIGKATGKGFYGRWCKHQKAKFLDEENTKISYLEIKSSFVQNDLLDAEQALIWIFQPSLNTIRDSYSQSYAEVFWHCEENLTLDHLVLFIENNRK